MRPSPFRTCNLICAIIFICTIISINSFSQSFNSDGNFIPKFKKELYGIPDQIAFTNRATTVPEGKKYRSEMLERVNITLYNLHYDSLALKRKYCDIYGSGFFDEFENKLIELKEFLESPCTIADTITDFSKRIPSQSVPSILSINEYERKDIYDATLNTSSKSYVIAELSKNDPIAEFLLDKYKSDFTSDRTLSAFQMNNDYLKGWRQLEQWQKEIVLTKNYINKFNDNIFSFDQSEYDTIHIKLHEIDINNSKVVQFVKNSSFIKSWLWYTGGVININPLLATTPERRYPKTEKNSFLNTDDRKKQDSLDISERLTKFRNTGKVYNRVFLPVNFSASDEKYKLIEYDASDNYKSEKIFDNFWDNKFKAKIAIYNIESNKTININPTKENLPYESKALTTLNSVADKIGIITSITKPNTAIFSSLTSKLNTVDASHFQTKFSLYNSKSNYKSDDYFSPDRNKKISKSPLDKLINISKIEGIKLDGTGRLVLFSDGDYVEDKRRILKAVSAGKFPIKQYNQLDSLVIKMINRFVTDDDHIFLNYENETTLKKDINDLILRFKDFVNKINTDIETVKMLDKELEYKFTSLEPYIAITNRSLPPKPLNPILDTVSVKYTKLTKLEIPSAPSILKYAIEESTVNSKGNSKLIVSESYKVVHPELIDVSIGIGYNFGNYQLAKESSTSLPTVVEGDKFQFIAGVSIHFTKMNRLATVKGTNGLGASIKTILSRSSGYAGLGLKNALENYYLGLSYDLTPGIKVIGAAHLYQNKRFEVKNNLVVKKETGIDCAGFFFSIGIEPVTVGKLIGLF